MGSGFDRKRLLRLILNSRAYALDSATTGGNGDDARLYSHFYVRRLPAEALLDALAQATGVADLFPGYPEGMRAVQLPDPGVKSYFLSLFGRSDRVTACACDRSGEVTMAQLLHLENGESVVKKIRDGQGRLQRLLAAGTPPERIAEELFLASLSRRPSEAELGQTRALFSRGDPPEEVLGDLFWAILNSKEFSFNH